MVDARTAQANGKTLTQCRKDAGLTHESAAEKTDLIVMTAASEERAAGLNGGRFARRVASRKAKGYSPGLSKGAIASAERGGRIFLTTLVILSMLYGKAVRELCIDAEDEDEDEEAIEAHCGDSSSPLALRVTNADTLTRGFSDDDSVLADLERQLEEMLALVRSRRAVRGDAVEARRWS